MQQVLHKFKIVPSNLSNLKSAVDKLDVHKLSPIPVNLSKLSSKKLSCSKRCI